jgi:hypothetical protein
LREVIESIRSVVKLLELPEPWVWAGRLAIADPASDTFGVCSVCLWEQRGMGEKYKDESGPFSATPRGDCDAEEERGDVTREDLDGVAVALASKRIVRDAAALRRVGAHEEEVALMLYVLDTLSKTARKSVPPYLLDRADALGAAARARAVDEPAAKALLKKALEIVPKAGAAPAPAVTVKRLANAVVIVTGVNADAGAVIARALMESNVWPLEFVSARTEIERVRTWYRAPAVALDREELVEFTQAVPGPFLVLLLHEAASVPETIALSADCHVVPVPLREGYQIAMSAVITAALAFV